MPFQARFVGRARDPQPRSLMQGRAGFLVKAGAGCASRGAQGAIRSLFKRGALSLLALSGVPLHAAPQVNLVPAFSVPQNPSPRTPYVGFPLDPGLHQVANAVCNDGSTPYFFYRPAKNRQSRKWQVHLEGGRTCNSMESCVERFATKPDLMSSGWITAGPQITYPLPQGPRVPPGQNLQLPTRSFGGILHDPGAAGSNAFRNDYHQVFIPYCSSDAWAGLGEATFPVSGPGLSLDGLETVRKADLDAAYQAAPSPQALLRLNQEKQRITLTHAQFRAPTAGFCGVGGACRIQFRGAAIVEAVFRQLRSDPRLVLRMPAAPEVLLFSGSSAGSSGLRKNLDRVKSWFPESLVLGVSDAGYYFEPEEELAGRGAGRIQPQPVPVLSAASAAGGGCQPVVRPAMSPQRQAYVTIPPIQFYGNVYVDSSCEATVRAQAAAQGVTLSFWQIAVTCFKENTLLSEISTPLFIHQTYLDNVLSEPYSNTTACDAGLARSVSKISYNELLATRRTTFGYESRLHTSLTSEHFFNQLRRVPALAGRQNVNYYNSLLYWVTSGGRSVESFLECPVSCPRCALQACAVP